jgi:hypothetical protein
MANATFRLWPRRRGLFLLLALALLLIGPGFVLVDYLRNSRQASLIAQGMSTALARSDFLPQGHNRPMTVARLRQARLRYARELPGLRALLVETPARSGDYADYRHSARVTVRWEWGSPAARLIGGPYLTETSATSAVLPTEDARWTVLRVE